MNNWRASSQGGISGGRIGVFDSGLGGLTVLRALQTHLPQESYLYFGDTAHLPYGERSAEEIITFVRQILAWMQRAGVKLGVMACNTSSALALEQVRQEFDFPIIGLILPAAQVAAKKGRRIGVIATSATVHSQSYPQALLEQNPKLKVSQVACPEFVPLIEQNRCQDPYLRQVAQAYLEPLLEFGLDTLIYGCTHYPHIANVIGSLLPADVRQIDPAQAVAQAAIQELELLGLRQHRPGLGTVKFAVSGNPEQFAHLASRWLGFFPYVDKVDFAQEIAAAVTVALPPAS